MEKLVITGKTPLKGEVTISGAKNAAVAILPATLLIDGVCTIENLPNISDVKKSCEILEGLGAKIKWNTPNEITIDTRNITQTEASEELTSKFRASYYIIGSMLGRTGKISVGMPGGCKLGARPIDQHIKGFEALGAKVEVGQGKISASAEKLVGNSIYMDVVSVGATINVMLASVLAEGTTIIDNAAKEPHIVDVANFLNTMGADIRGAGTDVIKINGVKKLMPVHYRIMPDRIEAGTFLCAGAITGGKVKIINAVPEQLVPIISKLEEAGCKITIENKNILLEAPPRLKAVEIKTMPYPGFPTDMQSIFGAMLCTARGTSMIIENIFENRYKYTNELIRMGAKIKVEGKMAIIKGIRKLSGAEVYVSDLRGRRSFSACRPWGKGNYNCEQYRIYITRI